MGKEEGDKLQVSFTVLGAAGRGKVEMKLDEGTEENREWLSKQLSSE
jgi:hypothetical protein